MSNNYHVIDATNTNIQFISLDTGGGIQLSQHLLSTSDALPITNVNPLSVFNTLGFPVGANQLGNVSVTALPGLGTGTNSLGNVSVTSTTLPGLSTGANVIGTANVGGLAGSNVATSGNPVYTAGVYNVTQPVINSTCIAPMQATARGAHIVATGVDVFNTTVSAGLPTGANFIGNVSVTSITIPGLSTGSNQLGNVTVTSTTLPGLSTGANVIGLVNTNVDAGIGVGAAPAKCHITGGVYNTSAPAPTNGQTMALQLDNAGQLLINIGGDTVVLGTGANVIGTANVSGLAGSNVAPSGNPVWVSGTYNATQPTINSTCIAPVQMTTRGAQIVATGADTFNTTINAGLPTGANVIGNVSVSSITFPGLSSGSNTLGLVNLNSDAAIAAGGAPAKCQITGGVYNASLPSPTTGQTLALQLDSSGKLLTNSTTAVTGLPTGTNSIGNVSVTSITLPGLSTGANVIGTANVSGLAGSNVATSGNPVWMAGAYNATQPTINSLCIAPAQMTTRGGLIVSTGVDAFNATISAGLPTGANLIGNVSISAHPGLATGANVIGLVNTNADAGIGAGAAPAKALVAAGVYNTSAPAPTNGQTVGLQVDSTGKLLTNTAVNIGGLSTGANVIGLINTNADAAIAAGAAPAKALITGGVYNSSAPAPTTGQTVALQLDSAGKLLVNTTVTVSGFALQTGANVIGLVNTNADAGIGAGAAPAKSLIVGGVYNTSAPAPTNGQTVGLQVDSAGKLLVNTAVTVSGFALSTGSNVVGTVNCSGLAGSNVATSGNPVWIGGAYNALQPTINSLCISPLQMTTRGGLIVSTGVDAFTVSLSGGLPTGANLIGNVSISVLPGLPTSANNIGLINTNADAAIGAGAAPAKSLVVGGVYNTAAPTPTNGQTLGLQLDAAGKLLVNTSVTISSLALSTSTNNIGTVNCSGLAGSNVATSGNPVWIGGAYNATQPTINSTCIAPLQTTTRGGLIVSTGADAFNVSFSGGLAPSANNIGVVNCVGTSGANVVASGNPLQMGAVFNTTQPTINSTCIGPLQMTTRGAQLVATGVDTLNATINAGLPTGANLIGNVSISILPGLGSSANIIGLVNTNSDAALSTGTAPAKCQIIGGIYNTSLPAPTNGQTMALQMDSTGKLITNSGVVTLTGLPSGSNVIGSFAGISSNPSATPTISTSIYTSGWEIGGKMTFAIGGQGSGVLQSIRVTSKSIQTNGLKLYLFDINPTNSTWTDHQAPAINALDVSSLRGTFDLIAYDNGLGTHTIWNYEGIGMSFVGATLYGILLASGTPTFSSTSDLTVKLGVMAD